VTRTLFIVGLALALVAPEIAFSGATGALPVTAVVLANSNCRFQNPRTATVNFGVLDPGNPVDVNATATLTFRCNGGNVTVVFSISGDDGSYETGPAAARMRHATDLAQFLPYSLAMSPTSGRIPRNTDQTLTFTGTVRGSDYGTASPGNYSDTVIVSIVP
jgi:spore coat protein U-like protein